MYRLELYHKRESTYDPNLQNLLQQLDLLRERWNVDYLVVEESELTEEDRLRLLNDLRSIAPQARGKIVTSRGRILPLSGSKRLNLENTPIIVLRHGSSAVNVYPHMLGMTYFDIKTGLQKIVELGPEEYMSARGLLEEPLLKILSDHPAILEEGMSLMQANVPSPTGEIDLVMRDKQGRMVVIEIETRATDFSVGQVSRLADGLAQSGHQQDTIRKLIVCITADRHITGACKNSGIELFELTFDKLT